MATPNFLSPGEVDIIETAKAKKQLKKKRKELAKAEKELEPQTFGKKLKGKVKGELREGISKTTKSFFKPVKRKQAKVFGKAPVQEVLTKEQNILRGMFGGGDKVIFNDTGERHPPQINQVLTSGNGISPMKQRGNIETKNLMVSGRPSGFFGGLGGNNMEITDFRKDFNPIFGNQSNQPRQRRKNPLF